MGVEFKYERRCYFTNGRRFFPDFIVKGPLLIEVSGFAYESWKKDFVKKVNRIIKSGYELICVTYPENVAELQARVPVPVYSPKGLRQCDRLQ